MGALTEPNSFLTCVCFHVLIKILFHVEVFATPLAHELLVSNVNAHVGAQLVLVLEPLVTVLQQRQQRHSDNMHTPGQYTGMHTKTLTYTCRHFPKTLNLSHTSLSIIGNLLKMV